MKRLIFGILLYFLVKASAVVTAYPATPYRGRFDSPFYEGIRAGTITVEDFEDGGRYDRQQINIIGGASPESSFTTVDEDDGMLDNLGVGGRSWFFEGGGEPRPIGADYTFKIEFLPNGNGEYPTHVGAAILGFSRFETTATERIRFFDPTDNEIPIATLLKTIQVFPFAPNQSSRGDQFIGLYSSTGIGSMKIDARRFDHLQWGWMVPEPSAPCLAAMAAIICLGHRRR